VKKIFRALQHMKHLESTLLVLCGDHGMNNAGNHGGSAPSETSPALVFISPKLSAVFPGLPSPANNPCDEFQYYTTVEQSDLAPTLAGLLGFPVPLNSLGVFIPELLPLWPSSSFPVPDYKLNHCCRRYPNFFRNPQDSTSGTECAPNERYCEGNIWRIQF
jgi:ethanolaminephosphotransferase